MSEIITAGEPIVQLTENGLEGFEVLCRLCANRSDHLISIYSEEGVSNGLAEKMNLYLPVKVAKSDTLPLQCCYQCASTVLTWHELVIASVETDRRLRSIQDEVEKQLAVHAEPGPSQDAEKSENERLPSEGIALSPAQTLFLCDVCSYLCEGKTEFELHLQSHVISYTEEDNNSVSNDETMHSHLQTPQNEESTDCKPHTVDDSGGHFVFVDSCTTNAEQLYVLSEPDAQKSEKQVSNSEHECEICEKVFNRFSNLNAHLTSHTRDYACYVCCNSYASQFRLDQHMTQHSEQNLAECKDSPAVVQCQLCSEVFYSKYALYEHKKVHGNIVEYSCDECAKKFRSYRQLASHKKRHADSAICSVCGKVYSSDKVLTQHLRLHSGEKPYECAVCKMRFRFQSGLIVHERVHTGERKYKCGQCSKTFARSNYLKEHMRIHFNEKPFKCEFCESVFTQKNVLKTHVAKKHRQCAVCEQIVGDALQLRMHIWKVHPEEHAGLDENVDDDIG